MGENDGKQVSYGLFAILALVLAFQLVVYGSGYSGSSGDDYFRALMAYEWSDDNLGSFCAVHFLAWLERSVGVA